MNTATPTSPPPFSIFVWNDKNENLAQWCSTVREAGFETHATEDKDIASVVEKFKVAFPNQVLLDLLDDAKGGTHGYDIAAAIRKVDALVPIIIVTRDPSRLFGSDYRLEDLDVLAYFEATIMQRATAFREIAVRRCINLWHLLLPDHLLARHASRCLHQRGASADLQEAVGALDQEICLLPLSGSIDVWHQKFCDKIQDLFDALRLVRLKSVFGDLVKLFEVADPFYMAAGKSRRHLSHNVQVFLLGFVILSDHEPVRQAAIASLAPHLLDGTQEELFWTAVALWAGVALTHDVAYLSQYFASVSQSLADLSKEFQTAVRARTPLPPWSWPNIHHGAVGARLWLDRANIADTPEMERTFAKMIADGIARHDSEISDADLAAVNLPPKLKKVPLDAEHWLQFLAVLADELQNWQRERDDRPKDFRIFALDNLVMQPGTGALSTLWLTFAAQDHPRHLRERQGTGGSLAIEAGFKIAKKKLEENLDSKGTLVIKQLAVVEGHEQMLKPVTIHL